MDKGQEKMMDTSKKKIFYIATACTVTFLIMVSVFALILSYDYHNERERYHYIAVNEVENITTTVDCVMARIYTLNAMVLDNNGNTDFFEKMAKDLYTAVKEETGVTLKNIALAPEGIVEKVYPVTGNESLIGFNFMDKTKPGNKEAIEAYVNGRTVLTNPFNLTQGGKGIAGRAPVIIDMGTSDLLWGLVTVTMDHDNLMDTLNLDTLSKMGMSYRLSFIDEDGNSITMKENGSTKYNPVTLRFNIRNLTWEFSLMPVSGWIKISRILPSSAIIILIVYLIGMYTNTLQNLKTSNKKLKYLSFIDGLTGVYSRNYVNNILIDLKDGSWRDNQSKYSMMIVDIDDFKSFNDNYGHETGDRVVIMVANILKDSINEHCGDCVIRFGGDEFIVLLSGNDKKRILQIKNRIFENMDAENGKEFVGKKVTISGGIALHEECPDGKYNSLMVAADKKLYLAKEKGKNRIEI